uniref:AMP-binding protein n=1 Tax=Rhizorhapis sp. SPR117 TaxID=2912611 RepID=UPI00235167D7
MPFLVGTRTVLMESWNAKAAIVLIEEHKIVGTVAATPFLMELTNEAAAAKTGLPSLRLFACGGAAIPPDIVRKANSTFSSPCAFRVYGSTEVPLVTLGYTGAQHAQLAATTDGEIIDYDVRLIDDRGQDVPQGSEGEIIVRGPAMFMGYADEEQTREAICNGYFQTGDIGTITSKGALIITGRKKDLIIRGGENISAKEIEDVLHRHPAVIDAAVVAMPHARLGEGICAFLVPAEGASQSFAALADFVYSSGLAKQKCPERIEWVESLPRTTSGKIRKDLLREEIQAIIRRESAGDA